MSLREGGFQHEGGGGDATIVLISDDSKCLNDAHWMFTRIEMPHAEPFIGPVLYAVPVQLLTYHAAVFIGTDVGRLRDRAKWGYGGVKARSSELPCRRSLVEPTSR